MRVRPITGGPVVAVLVAYLAAGIGIATWFAASDWGEEAAAVELAPAARSDRRASADRERPARRIPKDWYEQLGYAVDEGDDDVFAAAVMAARGGYRPGSGLHVALRRAHFELWHPRGSAQERERAARIVATLVDHLLRSYRQDRALFASVYREIRFGEGRLGRAGGSLVREFRFREAADRIEALRPKLVTACYDALCWRIAKRYREFDRLWNWFGMSMTRADGSDIAAAPTSPDVLGTIHPASLFRDHVRPRLDETDPEDVADVLASLFAELGDPDAAEECLAHLPDDVEWSASVGPVGGLLQEIAALRSLRWIDRSQIPAAADTAKMASWFERWRATDLAHAIGADGDVEMGAWDDAMTASWLESGIGWAPEEWLAMRAMSEAAERDTRDGVGGFTVKSPRWRVFTDVSPEFAAQAALVLDSAWVLAQSAAGVEPVASRRIDARIYRAARDYERVAHWDASAGEWHHAKRMVLARLHDEHDPEFGVSVASTLVHETSHAVLSLSGHHTPSWLNEGLACFVQRWEPSASAAVNAVRARGWLDRVASLWSARRKEILPDFDRLTRLVRVQEDWLADDFGPLTHANYAAAESLLVYLDREPDRWGVVRAWLDAVRRGDDPTRTLSATDRAAIAAGWTRFVDDACGVSSSK